jgi:hypothetical protein
LKKTPLLAERSGYMFMPLLKTQRITSIRDLRDGSTGSHHPESGWLKAPPTVPVSTATAQKQNQQNDYDKCCRVHIVTPFLRWDWKLADDARTEPIRHFRDLLMDLLVGRSTERHLIRRSAREGGRGR